MHASDASEVVRRLLFLHRELSGRPRLSPSADVDALFGELVGLCAGSGHPAEPVLGDVRIAGIAEDLRALCAAGECLLERDWAHEIGRSPTPRDALARFPYAQNYRDLTRLELHALAGLGAGLRETDPGFGYGYGYGRRFDRVCFLGGGPLPLSALHLARRLEVPVDVVDHDPTAVELARRVVAGLAPDREITVHHGEATTFPGLARCDLVVMAALVGSGPDEKHTILSALHRRMRPDGVLLVRSAHGLRTLLYPAVDLAAMRSWDLLGVVHPLTAVINSIVVAAPRAGRTRRAPGTPPGAGFAVSAP